MKHIPYVVVIDMALITAKHALVSRREDVQKYEYNEEGILFEPYSGRVADPDDSETVTNVKENNLELPFPWILQEHTNNQSHHPITKVTYIFAYSIAFMKIIRNQKLNH